MWVPHQQANVVTPHPQHGAQDDYIDKTTKSAVVGAENDTVKRKCIADTTAKEMHSWRSALLFSEEMEVVTPQKIAQKPNEMFTSAPPRGAVHQPAANMPLQAPVVQKATLYPYAPTQGAVRSAKGSGKASEKASRKAVPFMLLYLLGALVAGRIYPLMQSNQAEYLSYYATAYLSQAASGKVLAIFVCNLIFGVLSVSVIFFSGLAAFGVPILSLFFFCKGVGVALLLLELFTQYQWSGVFYYLILFGFVDVFLVTASCFFAVYASKSAYSIFKYTLLDAQTVPKPFLKQFYKQYLALLCVFSGVCAGFAFIAHYCLPLVWV